MKMKPQGQQLKHVLTPDEIRAIAISLQNTIDDISEQITSPAAAFNADAKKAMHEILANAESAKEKLRHTTGFAVSMAEYKEGDEKELLQQPGGGQPADLKRIIADFRQTLHVNDIAGIVVLHRSNGQAEGAVVNGICDYLTHLTPSYSCVKIHGEEVRIRARLQEDFNGDIQAMDIKLASTENMLTMLSDTTGYIAMNIYKLTDLIKNAPPRK